MKDRAEKGDAQARYEVACERFDRSESSEKAKKMYQ